MKNLSKRLERLEGKRGMTSRGPSVILICDGGGEARVALLIDGGTLSRRHSETEADFVARASNGKTLAV